MLTVDRETMKKITDHFISELDKGKERSFAVEWKEKFVC